MALSTVRNGRCFAQPLSPVMRPALPARSCGWMGHAAVTTPQIHLFAERLGRGRTGQAGVVASPFEAWIDDWQIESRSAPGQDALSAIDVTAAGDGFSYDLSLQATGAIVAQGDQGYSVKSAAGQTSNYYSQPFYTVAGTITVGTNTIPVTGQAWLDREWSSQPLAADQTGCLSDVCQDCREVLGKPVRICRNRRTQGHTALSGPPERCSPVGLLDNVKVRLKARQCRETDVSVAPIRFQSESGRSHNNLAGCPENSDFSDG